MGPVRFRLPLACTHQRPPAMLPPTRGRRVRDKAQATVSGHTPWARSNALPLARRSRGNREHL